MRRLRRQEGLSLVEVTIMLLVLMLLTSVLAPSIFDFVNDAQWVKVKEDCEALAISVARLHKDVGSKLYTVPGGAATYPNYKMDIMLSDYINVPTVTAPDIVGFGGGANNWFGVGDGVFPFTNTFMDTCSNQLITNLVGGIGPLGIYPEPSVTTPVFGPYFGQGWRGAYLSPPCASDPWGYAYQVNTKWATMIFGGIEGPRNHCNDVFCLSPGKDGIIDTSFGVNYNTYPQGVQRRGDDWVTIIAPCDP
jgi:type II secretory pathway pseudopilin PulG